MRLLHSTPVWCLLVCAACSKGHPKWELPTEQVGEGESKEAGTTVTSIRCHNCNEMGHKASQCPYAAKTPAGPAGPAPQQGEQKTFVGKVTAVKEGFCFMESRPGERWPLLPSHSSLPSSLSAIAPCACVPCCMVCALLRGNGRGVD